MTWKAGNDDTLRGYRFEYDGLDRMAKAQYGEGSLTNGNTGRFNEEVTGYDKAGNIKGLKRCGMIGNSTYGVIDDLAYTYNGNQLQKVEDKATSDGFNDGANTETEYEYDENGNMTKDLNKNIADIQYNYLNLPKSLTFSNGDYITYTYDADGNKLRTVHKAGTETLTTDYAGNVTYENGTAKRLLTEAGYVTLKDGKYHYFIQDHQGNNRVVVGEAGKVEETNHYYPFGGLFASSNSVQPYKYNGKELDSRNGLGWYDYGARFYDAVLGRWNAVDPLSEQDYFMSPYAYCGNNPINRIDPDGMFADWVEDQNKQIYWDNNATSQATTKKGDTYLGKAVVVFIGSINEKLGKKGNILDQDAVLANVTVYGPHGENDIQKYKGYTMSSDPNLFGVVADGSYDVNRIGINEKRGPYNSEWTLNKRGNVPALNNYNPAYPKRNPGYLNGVFIHRPNNNGFAGKYWNDKKQKYSGVSEGCLLILPTQWKKFNYQLQDVNIFKLKVNRQ